MCVVVSLVSNIHLFCVPKVVENFYSFRQHQSANMAGEQDGRFPLKIERCAKGRNNNDGIDIKTKNRHLFPLEVFTWLLCMIIAPHHLYTHGEILSSASYSLHIVVHMLYMSVYIYRAMPQQCAFRSVARIWRVVQNFSEDENHKGEPKKTETIN